MRKLRDIQCAECGEIRVDQFVDVETMDPHTCGGRFQIVHLQGHATPVHGDDIPGGLVIHNLLTDKEGNPTKWYTKSSIREAAKARGYTWGSTHHVTSKKSGSDKNAHTTRWV